ncbi:MAG: DNA-binding protein [Tissierellia bacterium]|nr:DNA-binding protein [Tissierellia bacterium]
MIEKIVEVGNLFNFYGRLLTDRQYIVMELYYIYDYSLAEIGEELDISRQAVYDTIKRSEQKLYEFENTLNLLEKFNLNKRDIEKLALVVKEIENEAENTENPIIIEKTQELRELIFKIIENS